MGKCARSAERNRKWKTAEEWYNAEEIYQGVMQNQNALFIYPQGRIPDDIRSREFAEWLTNQYRLAMAKGIELANGRAKQLLEDVKAMNNLSRPQSYANPIICPKCKQSWPEDTPSNICTCGENIMQDSRKETEEKPKYRVSYLTVSQTYDLNIACRALHKFGYGTFHVGSSLTSPYYRDVDLRCILPDKEFDDLFGRRVGPDSKLAFLNTAISEWVQARTGLPIDFQFQRMTEANEMFPSPTHRRNAVGIF